MAPANPVAGYLSFPEDLENQRSQEEPHKNQAETGS